MEWLYVTVYLSLVLLSGFFSSAETALISLNEVRLRHKASRGDLSSQKLLTLIKKPEALFSTLLVGNNLVNVAVASLTTVISSRFLVGDDQWIVLISTAVTTVILLTFGEIIPKSWAYRHREKLSGFYVGPVHFFHLLFYPAVVIFSLLSRIFMGKTGHGSSKRFTLLELKHIMASDVEMFSDEPERLKMVNEIIDLAERDVKSVMTARVNMVALSAGEGLEGFRRIVSEKRFHTIPVFKDNTEQVVGVVSAKYLITPLLSGKADSLSLNDVMDRPLFVSEFSTLGYVLDQFRRHKTHFAVVVDEYGSTLGIVTQSDIFQNILGELDFIAAPVQRISRRVYRVLGNLAIDEALAQLPIQMEEKKDYATVAGFFIFHYGKMPKVGARLRHGGAVWIVEKLEGLRVEKLKVILEKEAK